MFNITICYNDNYLENINEQIKSILNKRSLSEKFKINIVRSSIDLLKSFSEEDECNILFLEEELIDLKGVSIIDLIRKYNEDIKIVIIVKDKDDEIKKIYNNYTVINKDDIYNKLEYITIKLLGKIINDKNGIYFFKTDIGHMSMDIKDIVYIECINKKVYINTESSSFRVIGGQFSSIIEEFLKNNFIVIHRLSYDKSEIVLKNKKRLKVSRRKQKEIEKYMYLKECLDN
mgnify:CR=1 FL=1